MEIPGKYHMGWWIPLGSLDPLYHGAQLGEDVGLKWSSHTPHEAPLPGVPSARGVFTFC